MTVALKDNDILIYINIGFLKNIPVNQYININMKNLLKRDKIIVVVEKFGFEIYLLNPKSLNQDPLNRDSLCTNNHIVTGNMFDGKTYWRIYQDKNQFMFIDLIKE